MKLTNTIIWALTAIVCTGMLTVATAQGVFNLQMVPATTVATNLSQCPTSANPGVAECWVFPVGGIPFIALSGNGSAPQQIAGVLPAGALTASGTLTAGHGLIAGPTAGTVADSGAAPVTGFAQLTGQLAASQLPSTATCTNTITLPSPLPQVASAQGSFTITPFSSLSGTEKLSGCN